MSIGVGSVSHYGAKKPGPGVLPVRTGPLPSLPDQPFGKMPGIDWTTGKHLPLTKPVITENEAAAAKEKAIVPFSETLQSFSRVDLSTVEEGQVLVWNGSEWVPGTPVSSGTVAPEDPGSAVDTLGSDTEGDETALTDTWEAGKGKGLSEWYVSRVVYDDTSDEVLYVFLRNRVKDEYGRLFSVSAETRVIVDTPVPES